MSESVKKRVNIDREITKIIIEKKYLFLRIEHESLFHKQLMTLNAFPHQSEYLHNTSN